MKRFCAVSVSVAGSMLLIAIIAFVNVAAKGLEVYEKIEERWTKC